MKKLLAFLMVASSFAFYTGIYDGMCDTESERLVFTDYTNYYEDEEALPASAFLDVADVLKAGEETAPETAAFPSSFDLRNFGIITKVEQQGDYGTCWAIAATDSAETQLIESGLNSSPDLSEWHLAYFTYRGTKPLLSSADDVFNSGGTNTIAAASLSRWTGLVSEKIMPYGSLQKPDASLQFESEYKVTDILNVHSLMSAHVKHSETFLKELIYNHNAVAAACYSRPEYYNEKTAAHYCFEENAGIDHAILLVGWDDNYPKENFRSDNVQPEHDGAFLVKNSWGRNWGQKGYFWISYEDTSLCEAGCYYSVPADTYSVNYQYDEAGWDVSISADANQKKLYGYMSNVFTAENDDPVTAVSFYTTEDDADYEISVYTGINPDSQYFSPADGTLASVTSGSQKYTGYHTVKLDKPVNVKQGESFSVVVKLTNHYSPYVLPLEASSATVSAGFFSTRTYLFHQFADEETDPSYISLDGNTWYVTTNKRYSYNRTEYLGLSTPLKNLRSVVLGNVCLKAFSSPADTVLQPGVPEVPEITDPVVTTTEVTEAPAETTVPPVTQKTEVTAVTTVTVTPENKDPLEEDIYDINRDGKVNAEDLVTMMNVFEGKAGNYVTDLNKDGRTNITDLILLKERLTGTEFESDKTH